MTNKPEIQTLSDSLILERLKQEPLMVKERRIAELFGLTSAWLRRARWEGSGPPYSKGGGIHYSPLLVWEWLLQRQQKNTGQNEKRYTKRSTRNQSPQPPAA